MVVAAFSTPAFAWQCMARSTNGAVGVGSGLILERAQKFAIRRCVAPEVTCVATVVVLATVDRTPAALPRPCVKLGGISMKKDWKRVFAFE
jgi:hypothetical protein